MPAKSPALNYWNEILENLSEEMKSREARKKDETPFDHPQSYLKIQVYSFVIYFMETGKLQNLKRIVRALHKAMAWPDPNFDGSPFMWVLYCLSDTKPKKYSKAYPADLTRPMIYRFDRQLQHAHRHRIPPELLIGFLFQSGKPDQVYGKANGKVEESWYSGRMGYVRDKALFGPIYKPRQW